ncbi:ankyrin repeat domain-containing protein [Ideonella alba]|uniref:Ankyrin repeat domain-containing protein n=1 Tax=Ideonella alba TaxID=2824118 RepID=A0A940Y4R2_9BURK|nr:ankyrin repeat domain-containing protein [Ideonella alba]MBQ0929752.1 ankyrin repeat domain-containing protein [Ideonella alba]
MSAENAKPLMRQVLDAIKQGDLRTLEELVRMNPDQLHFKTPFGFQTWLGYAAGNARLEVVQALLSLGFDANEGTPSDGIKPLSKACEEGRLDNANLLLDAGTVLETATSVQNPLFAAIVGRSPEVVKLLLERGIDATVRYNSKTMKNMDAVAFALMRGEAECARVVALWNAKGDEIAAKQALEEGSHIAKENAYRDR